MSKGTAEVPSWQQFLFPESIKVKSRFKTIRELVTALEFEAERKKLPGDISYIYNRDIAMKQYRFSLVCEACGAKLCFFYTNNREFVMSKMNRQHNHQIQPTTSKRKSILSQQVIQRMEFVLKCTPEDNPALVPPENSQTIKEEHNQMPSPRGVSEDAPLLYSEQEELEDPFPFQKPPSVATSSHDFSSLKQWLDDSNVFYSFGNPTEFDEAATTVVWVSPSMLSNYGLFGDTIALNIFQEFVGEVEAKYSLVVFSVAGSGGQARLAAIVLAVGEITQQHITWALQRIAEMMGPSNSFIIPKISFVEAAILSYQHLYPACRFVYDSSSVLRSFNSEIESPEGEKRRLVWVLQECLTTNVHSVYEARMKTLMASEEARRLTERLVDQKEKVFACQLSMPFIGSKKDLCERSLQLFKRRFQHVTTLKELLQRFGELENNKAVLAQSSDPVYCLSEVEAELGDPLLKEIRQSCEQSVFERFLEHYTDGLMNIQVVRQFHGATGIAYMVESLRERERFMIRNWQCACSEFDKTGIPCSHILAAAMAAKLPSYLPLLSNRWKLPVPHKKQ